MMWVLDRIVNVDILHDNDLMQLSFFIRIKIAEAATLPGFTEVLLFVPKRRLVHADTNCKADLWTAYMPDASEVIAWFR